MPAPSPILDHSDGSFVEELAEVLLGQSNLARATGQSMRNANLDVSRVSKVFSKYGPRVLTRRFEMKLIEAHRGTTDFGITLRRLNP
jgi:hypothetical protein